MAMDVGMDTALIVEAGFKLLLSAILGGAIGFERESHGQFAGFRTNLLVGTGACLMMMLSLNMQELFEHLSADSAVRLDPGRIASYAIASMGFLGGGAIIKGRGSVRGLTTAASLWLVTGLGLAVGAGFYGPAIVCAVISLVVLYNFRLLKPLMPHRSYTILTLTFGCSTGQLKKVREVLGEAGITILFVNYRQTFPEDRITYALRLYSREDLPWSGIVARVRDLPCLESMSWEESDVP